MISVPPSPPRYINPKVEALLHQIRSQNTSREESQAKKIKEDQKIHHSCSLKVSRNFKFQNRPSFNNKTKQGEYLDTDFKQIPYVFVPGYKNDTFIMPNRVFQKGNAGKRFVIKMKDTSIFSFRQQQPDRFTKVLRKNEKEETIVSRQNEEFNRIVDQNDGVRRAQTNKWYLKNRKRFHPVHASELFSQCQPMLEPKDPETKHMRKTSLSKTYDYRNKWRPATRGAEVFSATVSNSVYSHQHYASSVR